MSDEFDPDVRLGETGAAHAAAQRTHECRGTCEITRCDRRTCLC